MKYLYAGLLVYIYEHGEMLIGLNENPFVIITLFHNPLSTSMTYRQILNV